MPALERDMGRRGLEPILNRPDDLGATVMAFSARVAHVPLEPQFREALKDNKLGFCDHLRDLNTSPRIIELFGQDEITPDRKYALASAVLDVAIEHGYLDREGVLFVDHTEDPNGLVIAERDVKL